MKRHLAIGAAATALALIPVGVANATGGTTQRNSVSINQYADYDFGGTNLDVGLQVRCTGTAIVTVEVKQNPPETASPIAFGSGPQPLVVCDGKTHYVGVTVIGAGFDAGKAHATATVTGTSGTAKASRTISIRVV